ncbi:LLM class flavin-dependent oxidoreductase [Halioxenophilus aromaticivorans]|uniref:Luciferase-like domain-containing protein n=1 Tax=Halioxenophilus aromaticivorans TaxID=1306992 RepID=A0AAV3U3L6_9ALTE
MLSMRFDLRLPNMNAAQIADQYHAALDMAQWADGKPGFTIGLTEHHAAEDGYMSSPLVVATAMAARTSNVKFLIGCALLPMYDPVRLAEEIIALDYISRGRVTYVLGIGYRPEEYALYGLDFNERGRIADQKVEQLLCELDKAQRASEPLRVTPAPFTSPRPPIMWGGASKPAARRAGRLGLGFFAQTDNPELGKIYRESSLAAGHQPGPLVLPSADRPSIVFVDPDPDSAWQELGQYLLQDARSYAEWNRNTKHQTVSLSQAQTVESLREERAAHQILTPAEAVGQINLWGSLSLHPLCGGCPPKIAWSYLTNIEQYLLPLL